MRRAASTTGAMDLCGADEGQLLLERAQTLKRLSATGKSGKREKADFEAWVAQSFPQRKGTG
jgi:hypothetical protein